MSQLFSPRAVGPLTTNRVASPTCVASSVSPFISETSMPAAVAPMNTALPAS